MRDIPRHDQGQYIHCPKCECETSWDIKYVRNPALLVMRQNSRLPFGNFEQVGSQIQQRASIGGSVVEFSPATREARVRFPANAADSLKKIRIPLCKITLCMAYLQPALAEFVVCLEQNTK